MSKIRLAPLETKILKIVEKRKVTTLTLIIKDYLESKESQLRAGMNEDDILVHASIFYGQTISLALTSLEQKGCIKREGENWRSIM